MGKRELKELVDTNEPAIDLLRQLTGEAEVQCELLPPGPERENALLYLQVNDPFNSRRLRLRHRWCAC